MENLLCISCKHSLRQTAVPASGSSVQCSICLTVYSVQTVVDMKGLPMLILTPVVTNQYPTDEQNEYNDSFDSLKTKISRALTPDELLRSLHE